MKNPFRRKKNMENNPEIAEQQAVKLPEAKPIPAVQLPPKCSSSCKGCAVVGCCLSCSKGVPSTNINALGNCPQPFTVLCRGIFFAFCYGGRRNDPSIPMGNGSGFDEPCFPYGKICPNWNPINKGKNEPIQVVNKL